MSSGALEFASASDAGQVRQNNEDSWGEFVDPTGARLLVVCDGMGGHQAGERASREAVAKIGEVFGTHSDSPGERLRAAFEAANGHVHRLASERAELRGMGTTGVALVLDGSRQAWVAHVGDSRAYRVRGGVAEQLTRDHSLVARMVAEGTVSEEEAVAHPLRNEILRSLGIDADVEVDVQAVDVDPGDSFVLCSDGLYDVVSAADIAAVVARSGPAAQVAQKLVDLANSRGAPDNVTVQVARLPEAGRVELRADAPTAVPSDEAPTRPLQTAPLPAPATAPVVWVERISMGRVLMLAFALALLLAASWWVVRAALRGSEPPPAPPRATVVPSEPERSGPGVSAPSAPDARANERPRAPQAKEAFPEGWQPPAWIPEADVDKAR
jgi:protein phosphatase